MNAFACQGNSPSVLSTKMGALLLILGEGRGLSLKYVFNLISAQFFPFRLF